MIDQLKRLHPAVLVAVVVSACVLALLMGVGTLIAFDLMTDRVRSSGSVYTPSSCSRNLSNSSKLHE